MRHLFIFLPIVLVGFIQMNLCFAQENAKNTDDPFFPAKGKFNTSLLTTYTGTTPPPVLIADITYGISRKTAMGFVGGTIGSLALMGIKLNTVLYEHNNFRAVFKMNMIYYPGRDGTFLFDREIKHVMPWMFTLGIVNAEWKTKKNIRWSVGMGALETHCIDGMINFIQGTVEKDDDEDLPFEIFTTGYAGVSIPLSGRLTLRPEVVLIMKDFQLIPSHHFKVSPFNPYISLTYRLGRK